jgi:hypothetical protein
MEVYKDGAERKWPVGFFPSYGHHHSVKLDFSTSTAFSTPMSSTTPPRSPTTDVSIQLSPSASSVHSASSLSDLSFPAALPLPDSPAYSHKSRSPFAIASAENQSLSLSLSSSSQYTSKSDKASSNSDPSSTPPISTGSPVSDHSFSSAISFSSPSVSPNNAFSLNKHLRRFDSNNVNPERNISQLATSPSHSKLRVSALNGKHFRFPRFLSLSDGSLLQFLIRSPGLSTPSTLASCRSLPRLISLITPLHACLFPNRLLLPKPSLCRLSLTGLIQSNLIPCPT